MKIGSLFSGIGGLEIGLERAGIGETIWQVEIDPFCRRVLERHWPDARRFEDVTKVGAAELEPVDLICGGFPCQDVSSAGKGAGLAGRRSGLWFDFARIVGELRPQWVVVENVASGASRWVDQVVAGLEQLDYQTLPIPLSAGDVGAPHLRRRVFVVAHTERERVREQQGRGRRSDGPSARVTGDAGQEGEATDPDCKRCAKGSIQEHGEAIQKRPRTTTHQHDWCGSMPKPALRRVDDGVYAELVETDNGRIVPRNIIDRRERKERLRALGNAVVPQCAEVIGHVIKELML